MKPMIGEFREELLKYKFNDFKMDVISNIISMYKQFRGI